MHNSWKLSPILVDEPRASVVMTISSYYQEWPLGGLSWPDWLQSIICLNQISRWKWINCVGSRIDPHIPLALKHFHLSRLPRRFLLNQHLLNCWPYKMSLQWVQKVTLIQGIMSHRAKRLCNHSEGQIVCQCPPKSMGGTKISTPSSVSGMSQIKHVQWHSLMTSLFVYGPSPDNSRQSYLKTAIIHTIQTLLVFCWIKLE